MFTTAFNLLSYSQKDLLKKRYSTKHLQINLGIYFEIYQNIF